MLFLLFHKYFFLHLFQVPVGDDIYHYIATQVFIKIIFSFSVTSPFVFFFFLILKINVSLAHPDCINRVELNFILAGSSSQYDARFLADGLGTGCCCYWHGNTGARRRKGKHLSNIFILQVISFTEIACLRTCIPQTNKKELYLTSGPIT